MGMNNQNKVASYVSCPKVSIKYLHLEGPFKAHVVKFEVAWHIISSIPGGSWWRSTTVTTLTTLTTLLKFLKYWKKILATVPKHVALIIHLPTRQKK